MSDGVQRTTTDGVFAGLEAFDDTPVDSDDMDPMFLSLAPATDPADWQIDVLGTDSDFYPPASHVPHLAAQYIDTDADPPVTTAPPPTPALPNVPPNLATSAPPTAAAAAAAAAVAATSVAATRTPPATPPLPASNVQQQQERQRQQQQQPEHSLSLSTPPASPNASSAHHTNNISNDTVTGIFNAHPQLHPSSDALTANNNVNNSNVNNNNNNFSQQSVKQHQHDQQELQLHPSTKSNRQNPRIAKQIEKRSPTLPQHHPQSPASSGSSVLLRGSSGPPTSTTLRANSGKVVTGTSSQARRHQRASKKQRDRMSVDAMPSVTTPSSPPTPSDDGQSDGTHSQGGTHSQPSSSLTGTAGIVPERPRSSDPRQQSQQHSFFQFQQGHQQFSNERITPTQQQVHLQSQPSSSDTVGHGSGNGPMLANGRLNNTPSNNNQHDATNSMSAGSLNRRDADLLSVVRRLESSINTLDINARLCLRDALVSLSNKASNPTVPPTPQQEAMNRAAEYLVLRMLFLSGHQVMHTETPGVSSVQSEQPQAQAQPQQALVGRGSAGSIVTEMGSMVDVGGINNVSDGTGGGKNQKEEDTAATSTGTGNMSVAQPEDRNMIDVVAASSDMVADKEEKVEDGT